jgi:hypothetical protein
MSDDFPQSIIDNAVERVAIMGADLTEREYLAFIRGVIKALAKQSEKIAQQELLT